MSNAQHASPETHTLHPPTVPSAFTPAQIQHYLHHIAFPLPPTHPRDAHFLRTLHRCQITSIPYENLSLHYNPAHANSIDPQALYAKFLPDFPSSHANANGSGNGDGDGGETRTVSSSRGRGGFCFETAVFFLHVLRGLGFRAYPAAARIRIRDPLTRVPAGPFVGPRHVVNLVLLPDGSTWSTDVGFGGDGPTSPLLLSPSPRKEKEAAAASPGQQEEDPSLPLVVRNLGAQEIRLRRGVFPDTLRADDTNKVWFYEYRNNNSSNEDDAPWNTYYAFGEAEASQWDLECANFWVAAHPESFQRKQVLVVKFVRGQGNTTSTNSSAVEVEVVGKLMLADGVLKENSGGKTRVVRECRSEAERVAVLRESFGVWLTEEEREGIRGFETELRG